MKQTAKGFIAGFLVCAMLTATVVYASGEWREIFYGIKVEVNGVPVTFAEDMRPFVMDDRTFLPLRAIGEALGEAVDYDRETHTAFVGKRTTGDIPILDTVRGKPFLETVPAYETSGGSGGSWEIEDNISMAGVLYHNTITYRNRTSYRNNTGYTLHNLNGQYSRLSGLIGHVDGTGMWGAVYNFYGDGKILATYEMSGDELPKEFSVNLTGVLQLKIEITTGGSSKYAIANAVIE